MTYEQLPWKKWRPETTRVTLRALLLLCFFMKQPLNSILESSCSKISQIPWKTPAVDFWFSCMVWSFISTEIEFWCPWNFQAVFSRNIFDWLKYSKFDLKTLHFLSNLSTYFHYFTCNYLLKKLHVKNHIVIKVIFWWYYKTISLLEYLMNVSESVLHSKISQSSLLCGKLEIQ